MFLFFKTALSNEYGLNNDGRDTIAFKKGLTLPSESELYEDITYKYLESERFWVQEKNSETKLNSIGISYMSRFVKDASINANHYFVFYFDSDVSMHYLPHANASLSWIQGISNAGGSIYYSNLAMQA